MNKLLIVIVAGGLALGCTGKGEPTTPKKVVNYTENNVRNSAKTAPDTARNAGKRVTHAVDSVTGETRNEAPPRSAGAVNEGEEPSSAKSAPSDADK
jgi:hypothetical protein